MKIPWSRVPWIEVAILSLAIFFRLWAIEIKPPHFDEGINGWFADRMRVTGYYAYDPTNYHGPLHFYLVFLGQVLFGRELWALRLPAILASIGCVWLLIRFDRFFGKPVVYWAAAAMAVSPAYVFYGRYSIHESEMVFFLMLAIWGILALWQSGSRSGVFALIGGITGMILTKETVVIHLGCLILAAGVLWLWEKVSRSDPSTPVAAQRWHPRDLILAVVAGVVMVLTFYSGFFHDWSLVGGIVTTMSAWFSTGVVEGGHAKTDYDFGPLNFYWIALMARYEWPALAGMVVCVRLLFPSDRWLRFLAIYASGALLAYSIITYKTPWCIIMMLWPFYLLFGAGIEELRRVRSSAGVIAPTVAAAIVAVSLIPAWRLNFQTHSDPREPYVYVQTSTEISKFTGPLLELARHDPTAYQLSGQFLLDSYYPLPWMLGDFTRLGYHKVENWPTNLNSDVIVAEVTKSDRVELMLVGDYIRVPFRLRDGQEDCVAWFRAERFGEVLDGPIKRFPLSGK